MISRVSKLGQFLILLLWVGTTTLPLYNAHVQMCHNDCCLTIGESCPMEDHEDGCTTMEAVTPLHSPTAIPVAGFNSKYIPSVSVDWKVPHNSINEIWKLISMHEAPLLLRPRAIHLLI